MTTQIGFLRRALRRAAVITLATVGGLSLALTAQGPGMGRGPGGFGRGFMPSPIFRPGPPITGEPFSAQAVTTTQRQRADGTQVNRTHTISVARDANGRTWEQMTLPAGRRGNAQPTSDGDTQTVIHVADPVAHMSYEIFPAQRLAISHPLPRHHAGTDGRAPRPRPQTPQAASLGTQTIDGVVVTGTSSTRTIPAGRMGDSQPVTVQRQVWVSDQLHIVVQSSITDPRGQTTFALQNLSTAAPDASLFTIPSGYTVRAGHGPGHGGPGPGPGGAGN